jgi:hypothetical protein
MVEEFASKGEEVRMIVISHGKNGKCTNFPTLLGRLSSPSASLFFQCLILTILTDADQICHKPQVTFGPICVADIIAYET